ncbi:MAG: DUF2283 domain-containing protein [Candidatus Bipolaricaulota bacterium]|nr:DUF2283 domain-containing protein [Candidatus Bipolaricaulota bacterium]MDW8031750.1 hypothetical protein [Candidatus Bipolaricaulota bacterium]
MATERSLAYLLHAVAHLVQLPKTQMWLDYDEDADVLYIYRSLAQRIASCAMMGVI